MARRRNTDHYEELSPTLVVPDHFSSNKKSKIVIIYDESIGIKEDHVTFIFPGEVSGGALKKVIPQRIDSRTFVIETPTYSVLRHGSIFVSPQLRLTSGEVVEMADFKISLKHPVRNVMELCLSLSTQQAVLPVLLTLLIHANQDKRSFDQQNHFFQDPHFDQIMATLVGSMEPRTRHVKDIILPDKKWKRLLLTEFARDFEMQEMEKQAYMLSKRAKDKKKAKVDKRHRESAVVSEDAGTSLFRSHYFSNSTPDIHRFNQSSAFVNFDRNTSAQNSPKLKKKGKTLPKIPWSAVHKNHSDQLKGVQSEAAVLETGMYDAVKFDIDGEEDDFDMPASPPNRAPPQIPKVRTPKLTTSSKEDGDGLSLDSYEEMNEMPPLAESLQPWDMERRSMFPPTEEPIPPWPPQRDSSMHPDPTSRAKMPLPSPPQSSVPHYTVSTKQRRKPDENRPLPPEPKCPPPPSKAPFPAPKTGSVKKSASKRFTRRREDVYVAESESDCEDITITTTGTTAGDSKRSYTNIGMSEGVIDDVTGEHLYDSAEMVTSKKKAPKATPNQLEDNVEPPLHPERPTKKYQNVTMGEPEPCYDENPSLPSLPPDYPPPNEPPSLPPRQEQLEVSHNHRQDTAQQLPKKLPKITKPAKPKVLPATPPKIPPQKQSASAVKGNPRKKLVPVPPSKPDALKQMSELNAVLSNRNTRGPRGPPVAQRKPHWKRGEPHLPRGMTNFI